MAFKEKYFYSFHCVQASLLNCATCVLGDRGGKLGYIAKTKFNCFFNRQIVLVLLILSFLNLTNIY